MKTTNLLKEIREPKGANLTAVNLTEVTEPRVTTKVLAETLGVDVRTVNETVERLLESTFQKDEIKMISNGGRPTKVFTEKQATIIKNEISKHHNLASRQIDNVSTDYEMELLTQKVMAYHIQKANEYKQRAELAEKTLNRISDGKGCFTMNQAAKALKLPYGNITLYKNLKTLNILNVDNTPRQEQVNNGNFKVVVKFINDTVGNKSVTLVTSKGLVFLAKKLNTTIDESVKADYED